MSNPAERIRVIERSLRCFVLGLFGLVPLLGLPAAFIAIHLHARIHNDTGERWNPAGAYSSFGCILSWIGVAVSVVMLGLAVLLALNANR